MEKKDIISKIVETIRSTFEQDGFKLKMPNKFVKRNGDSLYIYEICVTNLMNDSLFGFLLLRNWRIELIGRQSYYKVWIMQRVGFYWLIMMHI